MPPHPVVDTLPGLFAALSSVEAAALKEAQPVSWLPEGRHAAACSHWHTLRFTVWHGGRKVSQCICATTVGLSIAVDEACRLRLPTVMLNCNVKLPVCVAGSCTQC